MPKTIGGLFGRSAFGPIHEHLAKVMDCVEKLAEMIPVFIEGKKFLMLAGMSGRVSKLEHDADVIKHGIREQLSGSLFSSVERSEVLLILKDQDHISDGCEVVAKLLALRKTVVAPELGEVFTRYMDKVQATCRALFDTSRRLVDASASGSFSSEDRKKLFAGLDEVHQREFSCTRTYDELLATLFTHERKMDPVSVVFLMRIAEAMETIAKNAENASDTLRRVVAHR